MRNRKVIAAIVSAALVLAPSAFAGGNDTSYMRSNQPPRAQPPARHGTIGLVVGTLVGVIAGGYAAAEMAISDGGDGSAGAFFGLWTGFAVAGALGGYAVAGGFSDNADQALELGRERIREAELAAAPPVEPVPELRLSSVAGFEQLAVVGPDEPAPVQLAVLR